MSNNSFLLIISLVLLSCNTKKNVNTFDFELKEVKGLYYDNHRTSYNDSLGKIRLNFLLEIKNISPDELTIKNGDLIWLANGKDNVLSIQNVFDSNKKKVSFVKMNSNSSLNIWFSASSNFDFVYSGSNLSSPLEKLLNKNLVDSKFVLKNKDTLYIHDTKSISYSLDMF